MPSQTLIISNLPADCDEAWLKNEITDPERLVSVKVLKSGDPETDGVTLVAELDGDRAVVDGIVSRFNGRSVGGREVRLYAPIFGG